MVNPRQKGYRTQCKAIAALEEQGFLVGVVERTGRFIKVKDLFGLYDLIAIKKGECHFVQVTSNRPHSHKEYQEFSKVYHNNGIQYWQWVHYDRKGWVKFRYIQGAKIQYDERIHNRS